MKKPNFFIVGAPKCGTTALSEYLRDHPNIFFSQPKEPYFFATDFPNHRQCSDFDDYLGLFHGTSSSNYLAAGEGSAGYLYSREATRNIYEYNPEAKLIVMLRNPVDLVQSLHSQFLRDFEEEEEDFESAWNLQELRKSGKRLPKKCRTLAFLQYRDVGKLGAQMERLLEVFPKEQVKVILFEDFVADTKCIYEDVLAFLYVPSDKREYFPQINENRQYRMRWLGQFTQCPPKGLLRTYRYVKDRVGIKNFGHLLMQILRKTNSVSLVREPLRIEFRRTLTKDFEQDIRILERIIDRDLSYWVTQE
jgi:hypothetical protein